jgi:hypothetical protein
MIMLHLCYLYLFMHTCIQHDFHIRWCSYRLKVTRWVSHMKQELLTIPEHPSSPPVFRSVRVARSLVFSIVFCRSLFVFLSFFFWPLYCLSLNLRILITFFGIFILFFHFKQLTTKTNTTYGVGNTMTGLGQSQQCDRVKLVKGIYCILVLILSINYTYTQCLL